MESKKSGNVVFASVLAVASLQVPGRESHGQCGSGKHDYDDDERERSGTKDSDSYRFAKNSTVLSIPTSQGVFGTRSEIRSSRLCDPSPSYRSGTPRRRTREPERDASRSAVCLSVRVIRERDDARAAWAPRAKTITYTPKRRPEVRYNGRRLRRHRGSSSSDRALPERAPVFANVYTRTATWLILPVVICLSQRLSHACLSTNFYTVKLRMAH